LANKVAFKKQAAVAKPVVHKAVAAKPAVHKTETKTVVKKAPAKSK